MPDDDSVEPEAADDSRVAPIPDEPLKTEEISFEIELQETINVELKPINAAKIDLFSNDPGKKKARDAIFENYKKAAEEDGGVGHKYIILDNRFREVAADIVKTHAGDKLLEDWIATNLKKGEPLYDLMRKGENMNARLDRMAKDYRFARELQAKAKLAHWAKCYADWSTPEKSIATLLDGYAKSLETINAELDGGTNPLGPIYKFLFHIAAVHLQLRKNQVDSGNMPGFGQIKNALEKKLRLRFAGFLCAREREDGSVFIIDADDLQEHRKWVLTQWEEAAVAYAKAAMMNKYWPDEPAKLAERIKALPAEEAALAQELFVR
jgi:hypothetical protein